MPHIILETTADLQENAQVPDILEALVAKLSSYESIESKSIKAYHRLRSVWQMGAGAPEGFAHCTVLLLQGRPLALRKKISAGMFEVLRSQFTDALAANEVSVTLELREMDSETYHK